MKKIVFLLSALVLLAVACDKEEPAENKVPEIPTNPTDTVPTDPSDTSQTEQSSDGRTGVDGLQSAHHPLCQR